MKQTLLISCPFIGPKLFWTDQIILLDGYKSDLYGQIFVIWTCQKRFETSKTN